MFQYLDATFFRNYHLIFMWKISMDPWELATWNEGDAKNSCNAEAVDPIFSRLKERESMRV